LEAIAAFHGRRDWPGGQLDGAARPHTLDELTGLGHRSAFEVQLKREWTRALGRRTDAVVVVAGLEAADHGSGVGDAAIREFAAALRVAARGTDAIARIGGEEFAILLTECDTAGAEYFERRLRKALTDPAWPELGRIDLSLGHAAAGGAEAAGALDRAEVAMLAQRHARPLGSFPTRLVYAPDRNDLAAELAEADRLTALGGRREFDLHVRRAWVAARRHGIDSVVVVTGLRARAGSQVSAAGDEAPRQFAEALSIAGRSTDVTGRIGGRAFAIVLTGCDDVGAAYFEARLRDALTEPAWPALAGVELSLGRASLNDCRSGAEALDRAEATMVARARRGGWTPR
jgi:diguanylate cyclase (GGDEF)-like protein